MLISQQQDKANSLYQKLLSSWPETDNPILREMALVILESQLGDDIAFKAAIKKLCSDFADQKKLLEHFLYSIAEQYYKTAFEFEDNGLHEQALKDFSKVTTIWEKITSESNFSSFTPNEGDCCRAGDSYYELGQSEKAIACFQRVIDNYPGYKYTWHALFMIGDNYDALGELNAIAEPEATLKTRAAYAQLIEEYPRCPVVQKAQDWLNSHN